jgi:hypothetical protein
MQYVSLMLPIREFRCLEPSFSGKCLAGETGNRLGDSDRVLFRLAPVEA